MKQKKYDVILFDMDGTIANSDPMIVEAFHILYDKYKGGNRRPDSEVYYFSGPPIRETLKVEFPEYDQKFMFDEFHRISRKLYDTHILQYPHCKEVLNELKKEGFKLGVVTNKTHDLTLVALHILDLDDVFEVVVGSTDVSKCKPDKEGMIKAINFFNSSPDRAIYIGDNSSDLETANNAGVDCCLVHWGPRELPKDINPTFMIDSYLELKEKLYE